MSDTDKFCGNCLNHGWKKGTCKSVCKLGHEMDFYKGCEDWTDMFKVTKIEVEGKTICLK